VTGEAAVTAKGRQDVSNPSSPAAEQQAGIHSDQPAERAAALRAQSYVILRHAYLENREFEPCPTELPVGSPLMAGVTTVLYNLFALFNPLQARSLQPPPSQRHVQGT